MLRKLILLPLLAVQVSCDLLAERMTEGHGEIEMFSRDAPLQARDLEHADLHGVNLTEMYRHARIKRDDGDHIILYVDRGYQDVDGPSVDPRSLIGRGARLSGGSGYVRDGSRKDNCFRHNRRDWTSDNSPFTGGVLSLKQWGEANDGYFPYSVTNTGWRWLVVAGSNSGANAGYRARVNAHEWTGSAGIGSRDLRADADAAYSWRKQYNGRWRAASWGTENCAYLYGTTLGFHYEVATWHSTV